MIRQEAVIGLGFGDEGKGNVVNYLCFQRKMSEEKSKTIVVRFSGGHQVGHKVVEGSTRHVFSNFGSGTLQYVPTYWSEFCTFDPIGFLNEYRVLTSKGIAVLPVWINKNCPVVTPFDISFNRQQEILNCHGSCGVGFGATIDRSEKRYSLTVGDLNYMNIFREKVKLIGKYYGSNDHLVRFYYSVKAIQSENLIIITDDMPQSFDDHIFEGSQGLLLDQDIGFFPHVTRANTGSKNLKTMAPNPKFYLVTRAYQTRHGNGFMTNEDMVNSIRHNPYEENSYNNWQGKFRQSILDLSLLKYGLEKDEKILKSKNKVLVVTCLDLIDQYQFTINGERYTCKNEDSFIEEISDFLEIPEVLVCNQDNKAGFKNWKIPI